MNNPDRKWLNRCLSKALAYHECGKKNEAKEWAQRMIEHLEGTIIKDPWYQFDHKEKEKLKSS